ncbi:MAG: hypothetical protein CM1200mP26_25880 [Acidimicrobiales bacterium]|nr:MAG: hypothetical protein CM1200mP26_25880 [Acidimicrobiales bacterium]
MHDLGGQEVGSGHPKCRIVLKSPVSMVCFAPLALVDALVAVGVDQNAQFQRPAECFTDEFVRTGKQGVDADQARQQVLTGAPSTGLHEVLVLFQAGDTSLRPRPLSGFETENPPYPCSSNHVGLDSRPPGKALGASRMSKKVVVPDRSISVQAQSAAATSIAWSRRSSTFGHQKSSRNGQKPEGAASSGIP